MTMQELREKVMSAGISVDNLDDKMVVEVAKILGVQAVRAPGAEVVDHTTAAGRRGFYIKTPSTKYIREGKETAAFGTFIPVEVVAQVIEDLQYGLKLAKDKGIIK